METPEVEAGAQLVASIAAQAEDFHLADLVRERLPRTRHVAIGFGLDGRLVDRRMVMEVVDYLLTGPPLEVETGVDYQPNRPQQIVLQMAVVAVGVLEEAEVFP